MDPDQTNQSDDQGGMGTPAPTMPADDSGMGMPQPADDQGGVSTPVEDQGSDDIDQGGVDMPGDQNPPTEEPHNM